MRAVDVIVTAAGHQEVPVEMTMAHVVLVVAVAVQGPVLLRPPLQEVEQHIVRIQRPISQPITEVHSGRIADGQFTVVLGRVPKPHTILLAVSWSSTWTWAVRMAVSTTISILPFQAALATIAILVELVVARSLTSSKTTAIVRRPQLSTLTLAVVTRVEPKP